MGERFNDNINDILNDRIDVVTKGCLGLTVTCARCHDHKFDPIPTKDYYSLRGIFASSVEPREEPMLGPLNMTPEYLEFAKQVQCLEPGIGERSKAVRPRQKTKEIKQREIQIRREIAQLEANDPGSPPRAMVLVDSPKPADSPVFIRGEAENKGEIVPRQIFGDSFRPESSGHIWNGSGRLELAVAIVSTNNPLTARVMVNRIWLHHFGEGL